jgi:hypothetical protein
MLRTFISSFFLFVICPLPLFAENSVFHWRTQIDYTLFITKSQSLPAQPQHGESLQTGFLFALGDYFYVDTMMGMYHVHSSSARPGYSYRGSDNLLFRASGGGKLPLSDIRKTGPGIWLGIGLGAEAVLARYLATSIYFFFAVAYGEPFLEFALPPPPSRYHIRISLPSRIQFRRDTALSLGFGVSAAFIYRP